MVDLRDLLAVSVEAAELGGKEVTSSPSLSNRCSTVGLVLLQSISHSQSGGVGSLVVKYVSFFVSLEKTYPKCPSANVLMSEINICRGK